MTLRKFVKPLLTIAVGLLACLAARVDSLIVNSFSVRGFDNNLTAMYSDRPAAFALVSDNLFNITGNPVIGSGLGTFGPDSEPLAEAAFALPYNLSGEWVTSFSNLTLPAGAYWDSDADATSDFQDWVAALPPDFDAGQEDWIISFNDLRSPSADYWDFLREPLASPGIRNWVEVPPAFEIVREWASEL